MVQYALGGGTANPLSSVLGSLYDRKFAAPHWFITSIHNYSACVRRVKFRAAPPCGRMPHLFGEKLHRLRLLQEMSQAELAQQLGLKGQSHISYLERGASEPSLELVVRAAAVLGVSVDYLIHDTTPIDSPTWPSPLQTSDIRSTDIGRRLRSLRKARGLTQAGLAQLLAPISQAYISMVESHRKAPSIDFILSIAAYFELTVDELLRNDGSNPLSSERA